MSDKHPNSNSGIQKAVVFDQDDIHIDENNPSLMETQGGELLTATPVTASHEFEPPKEFEQVIQEDLFDKKSSTTSKKWILFVLGVFVLSMIELGIWVQQVLQQSDWLAGAWLIILASAVIIAGKACHSELRSLRQLKKAEHFRSRSSELLCAPTIGQGKVFCKQLEPQLLPLYSTQISQWQQAIQPHHVDKEVLQLFEATVLSQADQRALQIVTKHASASAAMIAVSPFALLDMLIVLWRNLVMLKQVSQCYGLPLSYWGRIKLIKTVFKTMLLAGATEIVSDAGNYALSAGVTGKLSTRIAQGLGVGVMTTRIGIKAMHACRPMLWDALPKPGVSQLTQQLLSDLKSLVK